MNYEQAIYEIESVLRESMLHHGPIMDQGGRLFQLAAVILERLGLNTPEGEGSPPSQPTLGPEEAVTDQGVDAQAPLPRNPIQPMVDDHGTTRWKANEIVRYLLDYNGKTPIDMNTLAQLPFSDDDRRQFAQLIGYSIDGYGELHYVSEEQAGASDAAARIFREQRGES